MNPLQEHIETHTSECTFSRCLGSGMARHHTVRACLRGKFWDFVHHGFFFFCLNFDFFKCSFFWFLSLEARLKFFTHGKCLTHLSLAPAPGGLGKELGESLAWLELWVDVGKSEETALEKSWKSFYAAARSLDLSCWWQGAIEVF